METKKFGFKMFKWRRKRFNKKIKITEKVKLKLKYKTQFQKYTKT